MKYEMLVLDLDGTLTNSRKEITGPTMKALLEIQEAGKKVVLASGRPTPGVLPLAEKLRLSDYGGYILSYNGGRIIQCRTKDVIYNKTLPADCIRPAYQIVSEFAEKGADLITYGDGFVLSAFEPNAYTELEAYTINHLELRHSEDFSADVTFPVNKLLATGEPDVIAQIEPLMKRQFHSYLNIYRSDPFFLEIMPPNIDKAHSLQKLLNSIGMNADQMICCGDGFNDLSMIEYAGLGVAMENAQPVVKEKADYITKSNDEDGVLHVINEFLRD